MRQFAHKKTKGRRMDNKNCMLARTTAQNPTCRLDSMAAPPAPLHPLHCMPAGVSLEKHRSGHGPF